jgi:glucosamine-6-phosphate deaminase
MRVRVFGSPRSLARGLARSLAHAVADNPALVLGLPTGRTPIPLYQELIRLHRAGQLDCRSVSTFNLDEFLGVSAADPQSYRAFMQRHLFDHINLAPRRIHFLDGIRGDVDRECLRYERAIERAGGMDVQILGLGTNGHIGFNEPAAALIAQTHRTRLRAATRRANIGLFGGRVLLHDGTRRDNADLFGGDAAKVPREALSMGMATILRAERIVLIATGGAKAGSVARMVRGPLTTRVPASFLQLHRCADVWLDRAAASRLTKGSRRFSRFSEAENP